MIIVSITGPSHEDALRQIRTSRRYADLFEFRLDLLGNPDARLLLRAAGRPVIATCRPVWEGGAFRDDEDRRIQILLEACRNGAAFVDLELRADQSAYRLLRLTRIPLILSFHATHGESPDLADLYTRFRRRDAAILKFAYVATDAWQMIHAIEFLRRARSDHQKAIAIGMGQPGEATRILYKKFGGWATYAGTEDGRTSAPGQLSGRVLREVFRAHELRPNTRVIGLIGNPVGHSRGIFLHNAVFRRFRQNAVYCRFEVSDLGRFMSRVAPLCHGFSVTLPHKEAMARHVQRLAPSAEGIGAVNTVVRRSGVWLGANTDAAAALDAIEDRRKVRGLRVLILGAGGAARAIAHETHRRHGNIILANRTRQRALMLAREVGAEVIPLRDVRRARFDVLVNATSVGMWPRVSLSPVPDIPLKGKIVFDAVFNPPMTLLLRRARRRGATTITGMEMYVHQAVDQVHLFIRRTAEPGYLRKILEETFRRPR
jgi:3-dehydroquinate dehydratase/shikimate dehydrogenase